MDWESLHVGSPAQSGAVFTRPTRAGVTVEREPSHVYRESPNAILGSLRSDLPILSQLGAMARGSVVIARIALFHPFLASPDPSRSPCDGKIGSYRTCLATSRTRSSWRNRESLHACRELWHVNRESSHVPLCLQVRRLAADTLGPSTQPY